MLYSPVSISPFRHVNRVHGEIFLNLLRNSFCHFFISNEEKPRVVDTSEKLTQRSPLTDRYPRVFVETMREPSLPLPDEKELSMAGKKRKKKNLYLDLQLPDGVFKHPLSGS